MTVILTVAGERARFPDLQQVQRALDSQGAALRLDWNGHAGGYVPAELDGRRAGFELWQGPAGERSGADAIETLAEPWEWSTGTKGSLDDLLAALLTLRAVAAHSGGAFHDSETWHAPVDTSAAIEREIAGAREAMAQPAPGHAAQQLLAGIAPRRDRLSWRWKVGLGIALGLAMLLINGAFHYFLQSIQQN